MDAAVPEPQDPRDAIRRIGEELEDKARSLGLYMHGISVGCHDEDLMAKINADPAAINKAIEEGQEVVLMVNFALGDIAFMKRTQDPEQHEIDKEAQVLLPDPVEELREKLRKAREEGKDIFDELDDEQEE